MLRNFFIAAKILAFVNLLFVPAIAVLLIAAFITGERGWFSVVGLPALLANAYYVFSAPRRARVWNKALGIAGRPSASGPSASGSHQPFKKG